MKVWVVELGYDYEGSGVHGIYASESGARAKVDQLRKDRDFPEEHNEDPTRRQWESGGCYISLYDSEVEP